MQSDRGMTYRLPSTAFRDVRPVVDAGLDDQATDAGNRSQLTPEQHKRAKRLLAEVLQAEKVELTAEIDAMADDAERGRRVLAGAAEAGKGARKLDQEAAARAKADRDERISRGHSKNDACHIVADEFGVSNKTVERL